ncbi:msx2-interacting -like isoform X1 [Brachionus plicatilis]|uniref:Msx2-interacting-like isoform X1 n=1 Tax=Brachionus plicatilis TaxID=10195 RepID=A0A3M7QEM3_BRAPC|nr:msx2-interacting -like isoform X1 [Brachionus plicatilis]
MKTNRESRMPVKSENLILNEAVDRKNRVRNQSCSASSTLSSASSISSSALSNLNQNYLPDILIVYPNGLQITKKLDSRKAVYDILIELSATAKLIPTNYCLKLFGKDENDSNSNNYKLIDYTPNQTIGHLNPAKITIVPKTSTLKHQQHQLFPLDTEVPKSVGHIVNLNSHGKSLPLSKTPFELTIRVGVNLPFNQKTAVRVKPDISLYELLEIVCKEASLDPSRYDLVINSKICQASLQQKLNSFDTNEVTLVLKSYDKSQNRLNSKSSIATFHQNSTKSRSQKKLAPNTKFINQSTERKSINKFKSKSELDLSIGSTDSDTFKGSTSNLSIKSSMFSFFTRKKNRKSKSKTSLYEDNASLKSNSLKQDHISSTSSIKSTSSSQIENYYLLSRVSKKRPAPPPPPSGHNLNSVPEGNETPRHERVINQARSKSVVDGRKEMNDFDRKTLEKIVALTRKKKKAAPLPPTEQKDSLKVLTDFSTNSHENSNCKVDDADDKYSTSPPSFPSPSLSDSSSVLSNKNDNSAIINGKKEYSPSLKSMASENDDIGKILDKKDGKEKSRNIDCDSLNIPSLTSSVEKQNIMAPDNSCLPNKMEETKDESILDNLKKTNDDSILISDENCVRSFYGAVADNKIFSEDEHSDLDSIKALNSPTVTTSPLNQSKYSVQNMSNQITKVVINKNIEQKKIQDESSATLRLETKIPDVLVEATNRSSVQPYDAEPEKTPSKNDSDEETQIEINLNSFRTPLKKTAVIEVRPEFETSSLIKIADQSIDENNSEKKTSSAHRPNLHLKSPVSPPPQFPALNEKDFNEQHQNYTVVRHGDIIEKNGTYYSTDGTVRGYSGIVKRLANSKALNEVFQKQLEVEQQHEKEYQLELEKRDLEKQKQNTRSSIGTIVATEKKVASNQIKTVQYRKNTDNRPAVKTTLEDELSKKLESRRQTIANQKNLQVDTSSSTRSASSNSSPSIDNSSQNSPQSYFMSQNLHSIAQRKNSPSFVMSAKVRDSNSNINKINQDNSARNTLFEELKSAVSESTGESDKSQSLGQLSTFQPKNSRPNVAPKNFNSSTKENIQNKKQILNAREDLMDSIKSFSVASLKKINRNNIQ